MLEIAFLIISFVGSFVAGAIDLKTTEIPDEIPYLMIGFGILGHIIESVFILDFYPLISSCIVGLIFLGFGFLMYYIGQWGGGDAKLLAGIGFLLPVKPSFVGIELFFPFPVSFFFNVFFVGGIYMLGYIFILSIINRSIWKEFFKNIKTESKSIIFLNGFLVFFIVISILFLPNFFGLFSFVDMISFWSFIICGNIFLFLLWKFIRATENIGFKKKISVKKIREGDVLEESKLWEGLTKKQAEKIKRSRKRYVWIKEGVRFAPAFFLALLFTILVGDGIFWLVWLV